jgi:hypothetical protein
MTKCSFCKKEIKIGESVGRSDSCPRCGRDLRCCKQCQFYDQRAYNECREVMADRVVDKERANFCDYFVFRGTSQGNHNKAQVARRALEALFKK